MSPTAKQFFLVLFGKPRSQSLRNQVNVSNWARENVTGVSSVSQSLRNQVNVSNSRVGVFGVYEAIKSQSLRNQVNVSNPYGYTYGALEMHQVSIPS